MLIGIDARCCFGCSIARWLPRSRVFLPRSCFAGNLAFIHCFGEAGHSVPTEAGTVVIGVDPPRDEAAGIVAIASSAVLANTGRRVWKVVVLDAVRPTVPGRESLRDRASRSTGSFGQRHRVADRMERSNTPVFRPRHPRSPLIEFGFLFSIADVRLTPTALQATDPAKAPRREYPARPRTITDCLSVRFRNRKRELFFEKM